MPKNYTISCETMITLKRHENILKLNDCTHHSGLKLAGALISHNSLLLFFRLSVRVLLHGLWQKDTKPVGHWYRAVLSVDQNSTPSLNFINKKQNSTLQIHRMVQRKKRLIKMCEHFSVDSL